MYDEKSKPFHIEQSYSRRFGRRIGRGLYFAVYRKPEEDFVIKIASRGRSSLLTETGTHFYERMMHDIGILQKYLPTYLLPTEIIQDGTTWRIAQQAMHDYKWLNSETCTASLRDHVLAFDSVAQTMLAETGLGFDYMGSEIKGEILRHFTLGTPMWTLPSLLIHQGRLAIADCNLFFSGVVGPNHPTITSNTSTPPFLSKTPVIERHQLQIGNRMKDFMFERMKSQRFA